MKRITFFVAIFATLTLQSQTERLHKHFAFGPKFNAIEQMAFKANYQYKLTDYNSTDEIENNHYSYGANQRILAIHTISEDYSGPYDVIDSFFYNSQNQLVKLSGWQLLEGSRQNVYYVEYTYDANGNIATRKNYNKFGGTFEQGGTYTYTYNADNQIVLSEGEFASGTPIDKIEYTYEEGRLVRELWYGYDFYSQVMVPNMTFTYQYSGNLISSRTDSTSDDGTTWSFYGRDEYTYSGKDVTTFKHFNEENQEAERRVYTYNTQLRSETMLPINPELEHPKFYANEHNIVTEEYWLLDVNFDLQHYCDYEYTYAAASAAIQAPSQQQLILSPNPATEILSVVGLDDTPVQVDVIDAMGRQVMTITLSATDNTISVRQLPAGAYILRTPTSATHFLVR